jgi:hypothetical protein
MKEKTKIKVFSKKDWQQKRCFITYGRLIALKNSLLDLTKNPVILPSEVVSLNIAIHAITKLLSTFNLYNSKTLSYEHYCSFEKKA